MLDFNQALPSKDHRIPFSLPSLKSQVITKDFPYYEKLLSHSSRAGNLFTIKCLKPNGFVVNNIEIERDTKRNVEPFVRSHLIHQITT